MYTGHLIELTKNVKMSSGGRLLVQLAQQTVENKDLENTYKQLRNLVENVRTKRAANKATKVKCKTQNFKTHLENKELETNKASIKQTPSFKNTAVDTINIHEARTSIVQLNSDALETDSQKVITENIYYDNYMGSIGNIRPQLDNNNNTLNIDSESKIRQRSNKENIRPQTTSTVVQLCNNNDTDIDENAEHLENSEFETICRSMFTNIEQISEDNNIGDAANLIDMTQTSKSLLDNDALEIIYGSLLSNLKSCNDNNVEVHEKNVFEISTPQLTTSDVAENMLHAEQTNIDQVNILFESTIEDDCSSINCDLTDVDDTEKDPDYQPDDEVIDGIGSEDSQYEHNLDIPEGNIQHVIDESNTQTEETVSVTQEEIVETTKRKRKTTSTKKENQRKRMKGVNYVGYKKGQGFCSERSGRILAPRTCSTACLKEKGGRKCIDISEEYRQGIFEDFWENMDWAEKGVYVMSLVQKVPTARSTSTKEISRRAYTYIYHFKVDGEHVRVCKQLFLSTLGIKEDTLYGWINKDAKNTGIPKHTSTDNKIHKNNRAREIAENFLNSLPKLPSHYCRSETNKHYLETNLTTFTDVYNMYKRKVIEEDGVENNDVFGKTAFKEVFDDMNLSIFKPKKDQCDLCCSHKVGNVSDTVYNEHVIRKDKARQSKETDKAHAELTKKQIVLTMDVQSLLLCPKLDASCMYYKTKLCCHDFTFFDNVSKECTCYFWTETATDLTATTFTSCIIDYLETLDLTTIDRVIIYSDGCGYQNRNVTLSNALSSFALKHHTIIEQKYLERGHTQMECDSVHARIETKLKNKDIYIPSQYVELMRNARPKQPYKVKYCDHTFFKDYSKLTQYTSIRPGKGVGSTVVADIRQLRYLPDGTIMFKTNYDGLDYEPIRKPRFPSGNLTIDDMLPLRRVPLPIKNSKFDHLQQIKEVVPREYHSFFDNLDHV